MALVTVVVPTYNRAALLDETLRSILAQTVLPDEIIVVDDGSTDQTPEVCARQPKLVRYVRQANSGLPAVARNRGIQESKGEWIALCDSDDLWHPRKLEVELAVLRTTGTRWAVTGFGLIDPDGVRIPITGLGFEREFPVFGQLRRSPQEHFARWLTETRVATPTGTVDVFVGDAFGMLFEGNVCLTSSALIARDLIAHAGPFDPTFIRAEDTEFFHRLSAHAPVAIVMQSLLEYRVGHPSVMSARDLSPFMRFTLESLQRTARLRPTMTPQERRAHRSGRERLRMTLAYERLSSLDRRGARKALVDGWRDGELISPRAVALLCASLAPTSALRSLHSAKRGLRAAVRSRFGMRHHSVDGVARVRSASNEHGHKIRNATDPGDTE
jgi:glycosyltransferase involved in cell wall biosynthesis